MLTRITCKVQDRPATIMKLLFAVEKERKSESSMCQVRCDGSQRSQEGIGSPVTQPHSATGVMH